MIWVGNRMNDYKWVAEIPTSHLSNKALVLLSQFSRILKKVSGRHLDLQDSDLTASLVREFKLTDNAELHSIFTVLLEEFHSAVELKMPPSLSRRALAAKGSRRISRVNTYRENK